MSETSIYTSLARIQARLSVPKTRMMRIGGAQVPYRNAEDIYSAVKQLCAAEGLAVIAACEDTEQGQLKCTVGLYGGDGQSITTSFTVPVDGVGSTNGAQRKGAARSYALKYALCNLFAIDDGIDDDTLIVDNGNAKVGSAKVGSVEQAVAELNAAKTIEELTRIAAKYAAYRDNEMFEKAGREAQARIRG